MLRGSPLEIFSRNPGRIEIKSMKSWHRLGLSSAGLVAANLVTGLVVLTNQSHGVYPPDGDSTVIPIYLTALYSVIAFPFLAALSYSPSTSFRNPLRSGNFGWLVAVYAIRLILYVCLWVFVILGIAIWAIPHHYSIALSYLALLFILMGLFWLEVKESFFSTSSIEQTRIKPI